MARQYKKADAQGLYLLIKPSGAKYWRFRFRFARKDKTLSIGTYPDVSLKKARLLQHEAKKQLSEGIDPTHQRKLDKLKAAQQSEESFEAIAEEWIKTKGGGWSKSHYKNITTRLTKHIYPWLGNRPIKEITPPELLAVLRRLESKGYHHTATKTKQHCGQVFRYAIASGRAERDPSRYLQGALTPATHTNFATITDPIKIGELLRAIDSYEGETKTLHALKLAPLVFVRPTELRHAEWSEIDIDNALWSIPASKMKMKEDHLVPLSIQAIEILEAIKPFTNKGRYVFPSIRTRERPMSENTVNGALRRLGYTKEEITGHGFRAMASTLLNEQGFKPDVIERQLAHGERNKVRAAYNRAEYMLERAQMMQSWANYLDSLRAGADVIPIGANQ